MMRPCSLSSASSLLPELPNPNPKYSHAPRVHLQPPNANLNPNPNHKSLVVHRREFGAVALPAALLSHLLPVAFAETAAAADAGECLLTVAATGLSFCDRLVGTGAAAMKGQLIKAHYTGRLENGTVFDSSYRRGKPLTFRVGVGEVIKGWDQGILGGDGIPPMLAGGKRTLKLPPELGYGARGAGCRGG